MNTRRIAALGFLLPGLLLLGLSAPTRADLVRVQVDGLAGEELANVRAALPLVLDELDETDGRDHLSPAQIRQYHLQAEADIRRALQPFGYYRPVITAQLQGPPQAGGEWLASYQVQAQDKLPVSEMAVQLEGGGDSDPALLDLAEKLPLRQGEALDHRAYESAKRELLEAVRRAGYAGATYREHRAEVDLDAYQARVVLRIRTGPRYVVGNIAFDQAVFDEAFLRRYLIIEPGDVYNAAQLAQQRRTFSRSGFFQEVNIETPAIDTLSPEAGNTVEVPLTIALTPYLANRYRGRLGWGTDTGAGAQLDWTRRYLGGRGHHFNLGLQLAQERRRLAGDLNYQIPLDPLQGTEVILGARHESKDLTYDDVGLTEGGETRIATNLVSGSWQRPLRQWGEYTVDPSLSLSLVQESYDIFEVLFGNLDSATQQVIINSLGAASYDTLTPDFEAVVPSARLSLRRSDGRLFIRNGEYLDLELLGADESLGSNISFWQARLNTWAIRSLGERHRILLRAAAGYSDADSSQVVGVDFNDMPEYYEFRAGGVRSVRGYGFEELIPADAITGGRGQLVASVEYEYTFMGDFSAALFVDAGNAFNRWEDYEEKVGTGFGLRWRSPVGLARFDLGFPLDDSDDSFQIYITVGPEF